MQLTPYFCHYLPYPRVTHTYCCAVFDVFRIIILFSFILITWVKFNFLIWLLHLLERCILWRWQGRGPRPTCDLVILLVTCLFFVLFLHLTLEWTAMLWCYGARYQHVVWFLSKIPVKINVSFSLSQDLPNSVACFNCLVQCMVILEQSVVIEQSP